MLVVQNVVPHVKRRYKRILFCRCLSPRLRMSLHLLSNRMLGRALARNGRSRSAPFPMFLQWKGKVNGMQDGAPGCEAHIRVCSFLPRAPAGSTFTQLIWSNTTALVFSLLLRRRQSWPSIQKWQVGRKTMCHHHRHRHQWSFLSASVQNCVHFFRFSNSEENTLRNTA